MAADGTSLSAAHVTGLASLILQQNPSLTPAQVKEVLCQSAIPLEANCGNGIVNAKNAYTLLASGQPIEPGMEPEIFLDEVVPEYEETAYVKGEWSGDDHIALVNGAKNDSALNMSMVNHYVRYADVYFGNGTGKVRYVRSLHARFNYVAVSRFLYSVAYYYYDAKSSNTLLNPDDIFKKAYIVNLKGIEDTHLNGEKEIDILKNAIRDIHNKNGTSLLGGFDKNNINMASALMGLAIHVSTDAFAHRTMITTTNKLSATDFDTSSNAGCTLTTKAKCTSPYASINEKVCHHWGCLSNAIGNKWVDAIDIKYFMLEKDNTKYEDDTKWYPARFDVASQYATNCLLGYMGAIPLSGWQRKTFTPCYEDITYGYDLENLKSYYVAAGLDTGFLTDYQWSKISIDQ